MKIPTNQPRLAESEVRKIIDANLDQLAEFDPVSHLVVVAIRGYRLDSYGVPGRNDRRLYDDAHFVCTPGGMVAFNGNTDPNGYRAGTGFRDSKGMACLDSGVHFFAKGPHRGRAAFRQAAEFRVIRDSLTGGYVDEGWHAINWHSGSLRSTSSLGCQTNPPGVWERVRAYIYGELDAWENPRRKHDWGDLERAFPYILIEETDRRAGRLRV